jgi:peptidoglycan L-alanyl-D-glutamate endopeptidase CwlK
MFRYGTASENHIAGLTARLQRVMRSVIHLCDVTILDGIRTRAEQERNLANGASTTLRSKHLPQPPDNKSKAVDATLHPVNWDALERGFQAVRRVDPELRILEHMWMMGAIAGVAHEQGVKVRQGTDWNRNAQMEDQTFNDLVHTEILE